jgi:hypothetical protein
MHHIYVSCTDDPSSTNQKEGINWPSLDKHYTPFREPSHAWVGRTEVEAMEVVPDRGKIAPHDSKQYIELEFLNFTNPVQRKDAVHRKKVRKHVMKQS